MIRHLTKPARQLRVGGLVEDGSVQIDGLTARFDIGDGEAVVAVFYNGALPDLFSEGQGIIAQGTFEDNLFRATSVLAKHDETYMPREVADSLKDKGVWQGEAFEMIAELSHFALFVALIASCCRAVLPLYGSLNNSGGSAQAASDGFC